MKKIVGIYKITNLKNNKVYIGQTTNFHQRKLDHFKATSIYQRPIELHKEIQKDKDNFSMVIVEECDVNQLDEKEKYWTDVYSRSHEMYNKVSGVPSQDKALRKKKSKQFTEMNTKNWEDPEYRKMKSIQSSKLQKKRLKDPNYLQEKSKQLKKYTDSVRKRVAQYDKNNHLIAIYDGVRIAERATGVSSQAISKVAKHQKYRKTAGGYRWEFV
nr:GIY-YIG nuclease family protein [Limosilactobacillus mucosae]